MGETLRKNTKDARSDTKRQDAAIEALADRIMPETAPMPDLPDESGDYRRVILTSTPELKQRWGRVEYKVMVNVRTGNTVMKLHDGTICNIKRKECRDHLVEHRDQHLLAEGMSVTMLLRITRPDLYQHTALPDLPFDLNEAMASLDLPE
ncbi:hypothetical protein [Bifidobacterium miconisargentati]|uniref:hypothetical protein n=1 Tax=Bifidobacterium miconisargentati TaxID=2834437 RepID=UPI001BDC8003|nr:hypothetical protein [Bifidobacterium miconisargentati]MBW3091210.1 hypothetical protein [Bifidobacterium miconisargentati]